ncbi:MAG TPA: class I SAM-dependent methyltransferase [Dehalococcoidia bacterium]|nr:class I SAM-dependent methyltransferase [Dehalococcoidia bacterium]
MAAAKQLPRPRHRWFAFIYAKFIEPSDRKTVGPLRRFAAGGAHGRVLEIGAGTGANLDFYDWSRVDSLEMTEPDPFMAQRIQPRLEGLPADVRAKVHVSDAPAEQLPFGDGEFDCAVVTLVLCSVSDPAAAIAELRRVLKPGGELRLVEHVKGEGKRAAFQSIVQPVYGWTSGNCQLSRRTEDALRAGGFEVNVTQRTALGPLWPAFVGTASRRDSLAGT